jgi:hypothetical protein
MWEFPHGSRQRRESARQAGRRIVRALTGCSAEVGEPIMEFDHGIMHFRIHVIAVQARWRSGRFASSFYQQGQWLRIKDLSALPFSAPQRRLAAALA